MANQSSSIEKLLIIPTGNLQRKNSKSAAAKKRKLTPTDNETERIKQIYQVAARLFCERGYDATSMSDIAEAIGFTKAAIYHFLPGGKQNLLYDIISFGMDTLDREVIRPARAIDDPEKRLQSIIFNHTRIITNGSAHSGFNPVTVVVDEVAGLSPTQRRKIAQRKRHYVDLVRETLRQLQIQGKLQDLDITVAAFSLLGMILWAARWYRPAGKLSGQQLGDEIYKLTMRGILRSSPSKKRNNSAK